MNWKYKPEPPVAETNDLVQALSTPAGAFPVSLARILLQRGIADLDQARRYLQPVAEQLHDPFSMKDMDIAVTRIVAAMDAGEKVLIYGDYDVDGTTSVSLLYQFFLDLGHTFEVYVPDRFTEGYGISFEGVQHAHDQGCTLLIALDCGTKAIDKVRFARELGLDVIVVDHHQPGETLPATVAMLNPLQPGCAYADKSLSACGLTLKLCQALATRLPERLPAGYDVMARYGDLVALSIACDIVPLKDENRVLLHMGMEKLRKDPLPGVAALKALDRSGARDWTVSDMVFYLGPRINSAGRLQHATAAVALLSGMVPNLGEIAAMLDVVNEERKQLDKEITQQALAMIVAEEAQGPKAATVLMHAAWSKGVIGIVASRLIETYHRPTILFTQSGDYLVGSGRSVPGFDLHAAIEACSAHVVQFGGHKYAAGITLRPGDLDAFKAAFEAHVAAHMTDELRSPDLWIDARLRLGEIDDRFMRLLRRMAPFGPGNAEPNFVAEGLAVKEVSILKEEHVRLQLGQDGLVMEGIAFFSAEKWRQVNALRLDVVFQPEFKTWNGRTYVQLKVKDFRASTVQ